ncbi:putative disease resistance protein RGA1 [Sesamum alatum]|uniref:Disease resistance protein RGA1 n=1 Tax=Sesamum alatum TaxID=300844 RepID=A0AAE1YB44_9LAMI|nr:putative disease resistance protein RGA1 [Sesamum alatum]
MADGLVSAVVEAVLGILGSAALQEIGVVWGLKNELESLESILGAVQLVLQDAEIKQRKSRAVQDWVSKLKNAAVDAENILDRIATEGFRRRVDSERGIQRKLNSFLSKRNQLLFRLKMAGEVRKIRGKLDAIAEERVKFHLGEGVVENRFGGVLESRESCSLVNELEIYGRDEEKEMIVEKMLDRMRDRDDLSVYAIWGMGGLGKTTLAQMVYNDERTTRCFDLRVWICVSNDFSIQRLVGAFVESIDGVGCDISELDALQQRLRERLRGRRFLLVLDDVWNENHEMWDRLKEVLRCGSKGSVLMVTTQIEKVALMMATIGVHQIGYLSEDDSWSLFRQRAFMIGDREESFVAIGKVIVKKCGGVPLAIKALGSLMQFKSHESEWLEIKESEIWELSDDENGILHALRLSYENLAPQMRQCFAYCCLFPKNYVMDENQLIQLWMANGFVSSRGQSDLYLTGRLIFKELVWRSFLQDVEINSRGTATCKMHDLMHDLAISLMSRETYIFEHGKVIKIPKTLRHLSFVSGFSEAIPDNKSKLKFPINASLRSLIVHEGVPAWGEGISLLISKQQHLRALDVNRYYVVEKLPNLVCKLEHLRYLAMSCYNIKRLPESLTHLHNLQTLKLTDSEELLELPRGLRVMKNLWFLEIESFYSLLCTPPGLGDLIYLHELSIFIVGQDLSHQIDQLKELNLGGNLSVQGLDNVSNIEDAKRANLMMKNNLTSLSLSWTNDMKKNTTEHYEQVLQGLQPHQNLEKICIKSYQGSGFPNWMSTLALKNLKEISLEQCRRCKHLPPLGKLPSLTCLNLRGIDSVERLDAEWHGDGESAFPALTTLTISDMPNLEEWKIGNVESFPCLKSLTISHCPKLSDLPFLPALRSLFISGASATLLGSLRFLTSLTSLILFDFAEFAMFPGGLLHNLETLQIGSLPIKNPSNVLDDLSALKTLHLSDLESLPEGIKNLNSLEQLEVSGCNGLSSFPAAILEDLSSFRSLSFQNCKKLKPFSGLMKRQTTLQDLLLNGLPELEHLPESMQLFTALRELRIWHCERLCSLPNWLGSLESLSVFKIWYCKNVNSLPDGFKNLKSLRKLDVRGCPQIEKGCKKPKGVDWPKIAHIPIIYINQKVVQCLDHS